MTIARSLLLVVATAVSVCVAAAAGAGTFMVAPLTLASGPSPFAGCTVGAAPGSVL